MSMTYGARHEGQHGYNPRRLLAEAKLKGWTWQWRGVLLGLGGGLACLLFDTVSTAVVWFVGSGRHPLLLHRLETVLLLLTIPLLMFGAHCLDLIERQKDWERKLRFRGE